MGSKDRTVSFRLQEDTYESLRDVADDVDASLSETFREFVAAFNDHDGHVEAVPAHEAPESAGDGFPAAVEVPTQRVREHERLELEVEHLREQLSEHRQHATDLRDRVDELAAERADRVLLEDLDTVSGFRVTE